MLTKFLESTIDFLKQTAVSGLTQKHLDKRYENDFTIALGQATYYKSKDFLELIFFANSTFGATDYIASQNLPQAPNGTYTLVLRFYKVTSQLMDVDTQNYTQIESELKDVIHNSEVKFYSDDPSWFYQGGWEGADKEGISIYKFPGPNGKGIWNEKHAASGGLANSNIHLTKHLAQIVDEIDNYIPKITQKLQVK